MNLGDSPSCCSLSLPNECQRQMSCFCMFSMVSGAEMTFLLSYRFLVKKFWVCRESTCHILTKLKGSGRKTVVFC
jgi:hypothetical protein